MQTRHSAQLPRLPSCPARASTGSAATGRKTLALRLDVTLESEVEAATDRALSEFGHLDILVNNAGNVTSTPDTASFEKRPLKLWQETLADARYGRLYGSIWHPCDLHQPGRLAK